MGSVIDCLGFQTCLLTHEAGFPETCEAVIRGQSVIKDAFIVIFLLLFDLYILVVHGFSYD